MKEKSSRSALKGSLSAYLADQRLQVVSDNLRGDVLDIGCGYGRIVPRLPAGSAYVGLDSGSEILQYLRKTYPKHEYYQLDLDTEPFQLGRKFDTILMLAVVEHLTQPERVLCQASQHLKPDGRLLITTPAPVGAQIHRYGSRFGLFSRLAADDHETIFNRASLQKLLESCGLQIDRYRKFLFGGNQLFVCSQRKN